LHAADSRVLLRHAILALISLAPGQ